MKEKKRRPSGSASKNQQHRDPRPPRQGRDEMNLVEFPFATLTHRPAMGSITCQRWTTGADGERHKQRWVVQGGSASGLPTEFDERVYVALMALSKQQGLSERKVTFSVYQLLKIMGESHDSGHYRSVERSLERLLRASIVAEGAFWDAEKSKLVGMINGFHLIEKYWLAYKEPDRDKVAREKARGYVIWGREIWSSLQSGYLKQLDLDLFYGLRTPVARRLYRFLDKKLHRRQRFEIDIFQLSQQLGMAYYRYPAKVREKLQPGIDELVASGYLASGEMVKVGGYTRMRFRKGAGRPKVGSEASKEQPPRKTVQSSCGQYGCLAKVWRKEMAQHYRVSDEYADLWDKALKRAEKKVSTVLHQIWLARTLLIDLDKKVATVLVPDAFFGNRIESHYGAQLKSILSGLLGSQVAIKYRLHKQ